MIRDFRLMFFVATCDIVQNYPSTSYVILNFVITSTEFVITDPYADVIEVFGIY